MSSTPPAEKYRGVIDALRRIPQREGWIVRPATHMRCLCMHSCLRLLQMYLLAGVYRALLPHVW